MQPEFIDFANDLPEWKNVPETAGLPGSNGFLAENSYTRIELAEYKGGFFTIVYLVLHFLKHINFSFRKKSGGIDFEAVLSGELQSRSDNGETVRLQAGQYHLTRNSELPASFNDSGVCKYFTTHFTDAFLVQSGLKDIIQPTSVKHMTDEMQTLVNKILHNPADDQSRVFFYDLAVRELFDLYLKQDAVDRLEEFQDPAEHADAILQKDICHHYPIEELARKTHTSSTILQRLFRERFNMGLFERLRHHRIERAKILLQSGNLLLDDVAEQTGYFSSASFIRAFKRATGVTPHQWRLKK